MAGCFGDGTAALGALFDGFRLERFGEMRLVHDIPLLDLA